MKKEMKIKDHECVILQIKILHISWRMSSLKNLIKLMISQQKTNPNSKANIFVINYK